MNKKILVAAIAVATAAVSTSAFAATKLGSATQKGSVLIFPRVEAYGANNSGRPYPGQTDTYISITNDSKTPVNLQCYWGTTEGVPYNVYGGNARSNDANAAANRVAIRNNHYMDFSFTVTKNQPISFWAGNLSNLADKAVGHGFFSKLTTTKDAPQFNQFQDGYEANAGELKCWAVNSAGEREIHHNHLFGKATVVTFNEYGSTYDAGTADAGQAHEYNAWAFQALYNGDAKKTYAPNAIEYTGKVLPTPGVIALNGIEYDQCPSALVGQFIPTNRSIIGAPKWERTRTQISVANCHEDLRQDSQSHITKLTYTVWNANETKYTGAHECMGAWYESDLGKSFPHFTAKTLKTDTAYFRAQPTKSALCNQGNQKAAAESDVEVSSVVGIQVNDIGGEFQTGSNLVGLGNGTTYKTEATGKGEILWDPSAASLGKK